MFRGIVQALQKTRSLFLLGDVQEELHDRRAVADQVPLEGDYVPKSLLPKSVVDGTWREFTTGKEIRIDPQGDHLLVVGAVENADAAPFGQGHPVPVQVAVLHVLVGGLAEIRDPEALWIHTGSDVLDGAVLTGRVHALEDEEQCLAALRVHGFLQFRKPRHVPVEHFAHCRLAAACEGGDRVQCVEIHLLAGCDAVTSGIEQRPNGA